MIIMKLNYEMLYLHFASLHCHCTWKALQRLIVVPLSLMMESVLSFSLKHRPNTLVVSLSSKSQKVQMFQDGRTLVFSVQLKPSAEHDQSQ